MKIIINIDATNRIILNNYTLVAIINNQIIPFMFEYAVSNNDDEPLSIEELSQTNKINIGNVIRYFKKLNIIDNNVIAIKIDDKIFDLDYIVNDYNINLTNETIVNKKEIKTIDIKLVTLSDKEGISIYRHSCAHILAQAVQKLFPKCQFATGPATDNGFYYDIDFENPISQDDLKKISDEMNNIIKEDIKIQKIIVDSKQDAFKLLNNNAVYKKQIIDNLDDKETITFYKQDNFIDLCRGPHLPSTGYVKAFKLTSLTGAYFNKDINNKMLTRIYGFAFLTQQELDDYIKMTEEAIQRDHNKLGKSLGLFMIDDVIGQGLPLFMPKGAKLYQILNRFVEDEEEKLGYMLTRTPNMAKSDLYKISGHWYHYKDNMFLLNQEDEKNIMALRPMTCPFQYEIYKHDIKSYRDLPARYSETATLYRNEISGEMHGLIRVRQFSLADAHIICTQEQVGQEFAGCLNLIKYILKCLGLDKDITYRFSKRDKNNKIKYIDNDEAWNATESFMKQILDDLKINYYEAEDEAAFYGPKLDIQIKNVFGKEDTIMTIQLDFAASKNFNLQYVDKDGTKKFPLVIHRSSIGCYERTIAMLIEKYAGAFPLWFSPVQVSVLTISEKSLDYAKNIVNKLRNYNIRVEFNDKNDKINNKIRIAKQNKIPYIIIIGENEIINNNIAVRKRGDDNTNYCNIDEFINKITYEINNKIID